MSKEKHETECLENVPIAGKEDKKKLLKVLLIAIPITIIIIVLLITIIMWVSSNNKSEYTSERIADYIIENSEYKLKTKDQNCYLEKCISSSNILYKEKIAATLYIFKTSSVAKAYYHYYEWINDKYLVEIANKEEYEGLLEEERTVNVVNQNTLIIIYNEDEDIQDDIIIQFKNSFSKFKKVKDMAVEEDEDLFNQLVSDKKEYFNKIITEIDERLSEIEKGISNYSRNDISKIKKELDDIKRIPKYKIKCDKILEKITQREQELTKQETEEMRKKVNEITSSINSLKKTLNRKEYNSIKNEIESLNDSFYDSYKNTWEKELESLLTKIEKKEVEDYKKSCLKINYKNVLRYPEKYEGQNVYAFGEVVQKISDNEYRVNIDCTKSSYSNYYFCDNTIYVTYYGDIRLIEDDMVYIYGEMDGTVTYTTVLGAEMTVPKVKAKYIVIK